MQQEEYENIWSQVIFKIKTYDNIDTSQIDAFFSRLHPQALSEGFLMLSADTSFIKMWIESHYTAVIKRALEEIYGVPFTLAIELDPSVNKETIPPAETPSSKSQANAAASKEESIHIDMAQETDSSSHKSSYTFENFVIGSSNQLAYSMALAVAESPGKTKINPLFIYGRSGIGKTHLLRAIQDSVERNYPQMRCVYVDTMEFVDDYTNAATSGSVKAFREFRKRYEAADVLLIDDVQGLQNKRETLNMVFQIFNKMLDKGKQVVLSADRAPKNIDIEERYKSRFNQAPCDIQPPEFETKLGIVKNYVEECKNDGTAAGFTLSKDIQEYIARNSGSNIRELKGAVIKVILAMNNREGHHMTVEEVGHLLEDHFSGGAMKRVNISDVQKAVEEYYRISHAELVGKKRTANIAYARQMAIYLSRSLIDVPYSTIGKAFNRDHTTVMYSERAITDKMKENRNIVEEIEILQQMITER